MAKKIVGMTIVGPGEADRMLIPTLDRNRQLVDDMVICGNNPDPKTEKVCKESGFWYYRDDREWGKLQPIIKEELLKKVGKLKPDWILPFDADEIYDKYFTREAANKLMETAAIGYYLAICNLWNDELHYRHDASFWNIRFFKYTPHLGGNYSRSPVHCGWAPPYVYAYGWHAPYFIKHYGLMKEEDRVRKWERYQQYDPKAQYKGREYYDKLKPGNNTSVYPFDEEVFHQRIARDVETNYKHQYKKVIHEARH